MATHTQPGVYIQQQTIPITRPERATAVPVFIGYTGKGGPSQQLHTINAFADYVVKLDSGKRLEFTNSVRLDSTTAQKTEMKNGYLYTALQHYFEIGGDPCFVLSVGERNPGDALNNDTILQNLKDAARSPALAKEPDITLMVMPDLALLNETYGASGNTKETVAQQWADVYTAILETCQKNNWFALLESPLDVDLAKELAKRSFNEYGEYGAAYWPHLKVSSSSSAQYIPPCAAVAAMVQRIDQEKGVWRAPANVPLPQVIAPSDSHWMAQDLFNAQGPSINVIRNFVGRGMRVWGCRTLADSRRVQHQYIQVRRLLTYIELNVTEMSRFATFEPNNEITWLKLKGLTQSWLRQLWFEGGLFGAVEEDAFRVLIGLNETMTREDVLAGKLIMQVRIAPLYPAEFIDLTLQFYTSESNMTQSVPVAFQQNRSIPA